MVLSDYFAKRGLETRDIPRALIYFKGLNYGLWIGGIAVCYRFQPLRSIFRRPGPKRFKEWLQFKYPKVFARGEAYVVSKSYQLAQSRFFKPLPDSLGLNAREFALALAENIVLYKATMPVHLPMQFWFIMYCIASRKASFQEYIDDTASWADLKDPHPTWGCSNWGNPFHTT
eukprot:TRINITY_DN4616_c0_g1_i1.p2 TRINITY_DN4616_c0_g1~~TRINITY_DN4616_c0_g1_i1.p2  ORF type:complete len:173 (+),score=35.45 TRINITY_DN4616_c0_g1_i1:209-727(+)